MKVGQGANKNPPGDFGLLGHGGKDQFCWGTLPPMIMEFKNGSLPKNTFSGHIRQFSEGYCPGFVGTRQEIATAEMGKTYLLS